MLIVKFCNKITPQEIQQFRGAVIASLNEKDILFHNHTEDGVSYHYPRIQYKRIHQKAAIVCVKEGIKAIGELFCADNYQYNWLPLNSENYKEYQAIEGLAQRITFLEGKLIGNLLAFFTEMGFRAEKQIDLHITDIKDQRLAHYKGVKLMAFDVEFKANLILPQYIGIGKSASVGFGTMTKIREKRM